MITNLIPYNELETLFLDVGNTLISMDFTWICTELKHRGIICDERELQRAEASARPEVSAAVSQLKSKESEEVFAFYFLNILNKLPAGQVLNHSKLTEITDELVPILRQPGQTQRLWSNVLPGVIEALDILQQVGLQLVVVSNSDGTVEDGLIEQNLQQYFEFVIDSHVVGFQKPDPRIFNHALERSGANPKRTLHVGDIYDVDIVGARTAGLHALLLDPFDDWQNYDCVRLPDLLSLSKKILESADQQR